VKEDVLCHGDATGSIELTVIGGTQPFTYLWSNTSISGSISNLVAGIYNYQVTDANGCIETGSVEILQPAAPLSVIPTIEAVSCNGFSDGSIVLAVSGGTTNYTYAWQNSQFLLSQTGNSLIDFPADDYRYEITDANGCKLIDTLTISEPTLLVSTISGVDILCKGDSTGSASIVVSGGVTPYSYTWNTGDVVSSITDLPTGNYDVTVVDGNNCVLTNSIFLNEPQDSLSFTFETEDVLCNDGNNGSIALTVEGGTSPYAYAWSNGDTFPLLSGLTAGMYSFVVTDNNGCTITDSIEIFQPDPLVMNETITNVTCFGFSDGIIDIEPTGGTTPYNYTWFNSTFALSSTNQDLIDYPADVYQVVITDTNGCVYESFFELTEPDVLEVSYSFNPISCFNGTDGNVFIEVQGGTPAYDFNWSNGSTSQDLINVPFGVYNLIVTDAQNCVDSIEATLDQPEPITMTFTTEEVTCVDQFDGIAEVFPTGGNGGYLYSWSNGETNSLNEGLSNQWYTVVITDILDCTGQDSVFIERNLIGCIDPVNAFSPNADNYNDTWVIDNIELYPNMHMQIYNKWGGLVFNLEGDYMPWDGTQNERPLPSEVYYYILKLNNEENDVLTGNITIIR
jgi:gliding motility-associated-like protein